ncbi:MAG: deoxyribodipyrimidine photo-lyase [Flavobacteriales bacterium]|nr:deoxyribodipyrimidine photo-lyase [Flavobacteriales bacterium]
MESINLFWFRRDLRLHDNCGLYHALNSGKPVLAIFIFDKNILSDLEDKKDARLTFIHQQLEKINEKLHTKGSALITLYDTPEKAFEKLTSEYQVDTVYTNNDYEPYARNRDNEIKLLLKKRGIKFNSYKDQVIFEKEELVKSDGTPYLVYTPYSKKWLSMVNSKQLLPYKSGLSFHNWLQIPPREINTIASLGFKRSRLSFPEQELNNEMLLSYEAERDFPEKDSTSKLGIHLRFGTISIRDLCAIVETQSLTFYKELIWREFFMMILYHFPQVVEKNFYSKFDAIQWRNNEEDFEKWCLGKTGFPMVDAGMRELNETGFMHNRVRMVAASFLCKHLLIDWKWGEAYFAHKLLDYDLASNNGNWQWCAGTGVDASPYFRVFNPTIQLEKFDRNHVYINRWIKDFNELSYPKPMLDHKMARERAISVYKAAVGGL